MFFLKKTFFSHEYIINKDLWYLFHIIMTFFYFDRPFVLEKTDPGDWKPTYFKVWPKL